MMIRIFTGFLLAASVTACSSSGDTADLMMESARTCAAVCTEHASIESFSFEAGGGSPLLFSGKIAADCGCSDADARAALPSAGERRRAGAPDRDLTPGGGGATVAIAATRFPRHRLNARRRLAPAGAGGVSVSLARVSS